MQSVARQKIGTYTRVDIETASQGKLIVMLFNGAIKRSEEAKRQLAKRDFQAAHNNLVRAQDILAELRGALNMNAGEIAHNLDRIYEYLQHLLITANIHKESESIDVCCGFLTSLRDTWQEVFGKLAREESQPAAPAINQHGNVMLNVRG